jgi:hypothetical protein
VPGAWWLVCHRDVTENHRFRCGDPASRRFRATDVDGNGTDGGRLANKAIPEERLGQPPPGRDDA